MASLNLCVLCWGFLLENLDLASQNHRLWERQGTVEKPRTVAHCRREQDWGLCKRQTWTPRPGRSDSVTLGEGSAPAPWLSSTVSSSALLPGGTKLRGGSKMPGPWPCEVTELCLNLKEFRSISLFLWVFWGDGVLPWIIINKVRGHLQDKY